MPVWSLSIPFAFLSSDFVVSGRYFSALSAQLIKPGVVLSELSDKNTRFGIFIIIFRFPNLDKYIKITEMNYSLINLLQFD